MIKKLFILLLLSSGLLYAQEDEYEPDKAQKAENIFVSGMKSYLAEDYSMALSFFDKVIEDYEPKAGVYLMKARTLENMGETALATKAAEKCLELDAVNSFYQQYLAGLYTKNQEYEKAEDIYRKIIKKDPLDLESHVLLADIYETKGDYDQALKVYDALEKNIGTDEEIARKKQALYLRQNKVSEAIKEGSKLIDNQPLEPSYVINQAQIMIGNNELKGAEKLLTEYLGKNPDLGEAHVLLAEIYRRQENLNASNEELQKAFDNKELDSEVKLKILGSFVRLVQNNPSTGQIDEAISLCRKMIDMKPDAASAYMYLGDLLVKKGELKEARDNYYKSTEYDKSVFEVWLALIELDTKLQDNKAIVAHAGSASEYFPNQPFFWYHYGFGNILKKDYDEAIYALEEARSLAFDNQELLKNILALLGDAYNETRQYFESEKAYEEALKIDPDYAPVLNNYSYYLALRKKKLDKATTQAKRLVGLHPENLNYTDTYAWVLFQQGLYAEAKNILEPALMKAENPGGTAMEHLGDILFKLGDKPGAISAWKKAKEQGQTSPQIDKKLSEEQYIE